MDESNEKLFLRGYGGRGEGLPPSGCQYETIRLLILELQLNSLVSENSKSSSRVMASSGANGSDDLSI
jgi:hypothetical protein